jgi:hypothetical protein
MRATSPLIRFAWAAVLGLLLALRSLSPAGFMPAFDNGSVTIVACPDGGWATSSVMRHHNSHGHGALHQHPCPYASASSLGGLGSDWAPLFIVLFFAGGLLLGRGFLFIERKNQERPPAIGPPIPA